MSSVENGGQKLFERNTQRAEDITFIRNFLRQMDQTRVLRWREADQALFTTPEHVEGMNETVAEHIGQMTVSATGLIHKARVENDQSLETLDFLKIISMIQLHDIDETIVGDSRAKNNEYYEKEKEAQELISDLIKDSNFADIYTALTTEYKQRASAEARFVKAIDEIQAWFYILYTRKFEKSTRNFDQPSSIVGYELSKEFPIVNRIADLLLYILQNPQWISSSAGVQEVLVRQLYQNASEN